MKAAIFKQAGQVICEEVPKPTPSNPDELVMRVVRACVCGSDLWWYRGISPRKSNTSTGHEAIGVVDQVGQSVTSVKPGDFIIVPFAYSCGVCPVCKAGFEATCPRGGFFDSGERGLGAQAEFMRVPKADGTVVVIPGGIERARSFSDDMLADLLTLSDVMATGYHAAATAEVKAGDTVAVVGDGAVGLCGVISAKLRGASRIIALSRHEDRQALAREFGATDIVAERDQAAVDRVKELTDGWGVDAVLECVGSKQSTSTALNIARNGAVIGRVGVPHDEQVDPEAMFYRNLGLRGGPASVRTWDRQILLQAVLDGSINPGRVFTDTYDLDHIAEAYQAMDQRTSVKSLLKVSEV
ncbi:IMP dehydrogenase [Bifidobacterium aemilianum]|uniref:IMP dehydrogenase n=1 Tax=Bifidobacterium aemilianum TaxID=2493120 RepID=A0A366K7M6_9BIFI|nr:zinc-dependent alcohol dehydrogenase family protein [Bifidobacterium aemilianum]RBP97736.1 IMP dehydrogenase [Bifidobacterium aemilianum]